MNTGCQVIVEGKLAVMIPKVTSQLRIEQTHMSCLIPGEFSSNCLHSRRETGFASTLCGRASTQ